MKRWENFPTQEELFDLWCEEAIEAGYIVYVDKLPKPLELTPEVAYTWSTERIVYKGTSREDNRVDQHKRVLFNNMTYRPDRIIYWTFKAKNILFRGIEEWKKPGDEFFYGHFDFDQNYWWSAVDVKSPFPGKNCSDATFDVKKKIVWDKFRIYINKSVNYPVKEKKRKRPRKNFKGFLWPMTWTPKRYIYSDKLTLKRKITNWKIRLIDEFNKLHFK